MADRDPETGVFLKGKNGGPGRPKGSRNKLGEAFLSDMYEAWKAKGSDVIENVIKDRPQDFLKVVAGILPQQMELKKPEQEMSDEELADAISKLDALLAIARESDGIPGPTHGGSGKA